ncbi:MAG: hypothetical protein Q4G26_00360 [Paracoccus sp. (in: a-proteobacteria)]|nr:hypothetical protein [Paracoccus sp. (in: a-proteobacteria)]
MQANGLSETVMPDPEDPLAIRLAACEASLEERMVDIAILASELDRAERLLKKKAEQTSGPHPSVSREDQDALVRQLDLCNRTLTEVIADRDQMKAHIEAMANTISWRITAPLRKVRGLMRQRRQP